VTSKCSFMTDDSSSRKTNCMMTVLAFICGNHNGGIFRRAFNPFLHSAFAICTAIVAPEEYLRARWRKVRN
jgi:hypothetical protein